MTAAPSATTTATDHLRVENVSIEYSTPSRNAERILAVELANLAVGRGEFVCVVGPSGCGKTTLLNAIAGFLSVSDGQLLLDDSPIVGPSPQRAMVFQQPSLFPWRSVLRNISYGLDLAGALTRAERKQRATELLELVGLADFGSRFPAELSGGMQQRVNLARALAVEPELLLLDEPFASIDAQTREVMQGELLRICADQSVTALFVTHDINEAAFLADRVAVFGPRPGTIVHEVVVPFDRPRDQACRRLPEFQAVVDEISEALYGAASKRATEVMR